MCDGGDALVGVLYVCTVFSRKPPVNSLYEVPLLRSSTFIQRMSRARKSSSFYTRTPQGLERKW